MKSIYSAKCLFNHLQWLPPWADAGGYPDVIDNCDEISTYLRFLFLINFATSVEMI